MFVLAAVFGADVPGVVSAADFTGRRSEKVLPLLPGEKLWAGVVNHGYKMPLSDDYSADFSDDNYGNQTQPLLLSNKGRYVWCEEPFRFEIRRDTLYLQEYDSPIQTGFIGSTLADVQRGASRKFFPAWGKTPDLSMLTPQYNTWIELLYNHNEEGILRYAREIVDNGFPPGVLMIDDTWQEDYGVWNFHPGRFKDPRGMIRKLHEMGFKVMLWICPFVSCDQYLVCQEIMKEKGFLLSPETGATCWEDATLPLPVSWWNGHSYVLDLSNPWAEKWFRAQLDRLVNDYGVDGFKFDAGDAKYYAVPSFSKGGISPTAQSERFARIGLDYSLNEYRACWKMGGAPLVQRLRDKRHSWEDLQVLIPNMLLDNLIGYPYSCPDLIAGGEHTSFKDKSKLDPELVVRSTQCQALMTMMQFSVAPWNILDKTHLDAVKKAVEIRSRFAPLIVDRVRHAAETGAPVMMSMEYLYPDQGYLEIKDQFFLGEDLLVAPMVYKGLPGRKVVLPPGRWRADDGRVYEGGRSYEVETPLDRIPYFERIEK